MTANISTLERATLTVMESRNLTYSLGVLKVTDKEIAAEPDVQIEVWYNATLGVMACILVIAISCSCFLICK